MNGCDRRNSVWDALDDDPVRAENLKLRSGLLIAINKVLADRDLKQKEMATLLQITQHARPCSETGKDQPVLP